MYISYKSVAVFWRILTALCGAFGLLLNFGVFSGKIDMVHFQYFTNLSSIAATLYFLVLSFWHINNDQKEKTCLLPWLKGMVTFSMCVTGLIAHFILNHCEIPTGNEVMADNILHYLLPAMVVLDWVLFDKKGNYKVFFPFLWCIPAYLYMIYTYVVVLIFGGTVGSTGKYPYNFMDIDANGVGTTVSVIITLTIAFIALGFLFYGIDKLPEKFTALISKLKPKPKEEA